MSESLAIPIPANLIRFSGSEDPCDQPSPPTSRVPDASTPDPGPIEFYQSSSRVSRWLWITLLRHLDYPDPEATLDYPAKLKRWFDSRPEFLDREE